MSCKNCGAGPTIEESTITSCDYCSPGKNLLDLVIRKNKSEWDRPYLFITPLEDLAAFEGIIVFIDIFGREIDTVKVSDLKGYYAKGVELRYFIGHLSTANTYRMEIRDLKFIRTKGLSTPIPKKKRFFFF